MKEEEIRPYLPLVRGFVYEIIKTVEGLSNSGVS